MASLNNSVQKQAVAGMVSYHMTGRDQNQILADMASLNSSAHAVARNQEQIVANIASFSTAAVAGMTSLDNRFQKQSNWYGQLPPDFGLDKIEILAGVAG